MSVFAPEPNLGLVVKTLRGLDPPAQLSMDGTDDQWQIIRMAWATPSGVRRLLVRTNPDYWQRPAFDTQIEGMQHFFTRFAKGRSIDARIASLRELGFAVSISGDDDQPDPDVHGDDTGREIVRALAVALDGIVFSVASFLDADMRALLGPHPDPVAVAPAWMTDPPDAARVVRRCMVLAALGHRADLELDPSNDVTRQATHDRIRSWLDAVDARSAVEPEDAAIDLPLGSLDQATIADASSRLEGLGILAWALDLVELPTDDVLLGPGDVLPRLAYLDSERAARIVHAAELRPDEELTAVWNHQRFLHWRLREFALRPHAISFGDLGGDGWFRGFHAEEFRMIEGDLAIGDDPIHHADPELRSLVHDAARERHLASIWLLRGGRYALTDTAT
ncbi:MAG: hypothetical protein QOE63_1472 [Acidimicrobiaceae bacterium]